MKRIIGTSFRRDGCSDKQSGFLRFSFHQSWPQISETWFIRYWNYPDLERVFVTKPKYRKKPSDHLRLVAICFVILALHFQMYAMVWCKKPFWGSAVKMYHLHWSWSTYMFVLFFFSFSKLFCIQCKSVDIFFPQIKLNLNNLCSIFLTGITLS